MAHFHFPDKRQLRGVKLPAALLLAAGLAGCATGGGPASSQDYQQAQGDRQVLDNQIAAGVSENENSDFKPAISCISDKFMELEQGKNNTATVLKASFASQDKKGEEGGYSPRVTPDNTNAMTVTLKKAGWPVVALPNRDQAQILQYLSSNDLYVDGAGRSVQHRPGFRAPMYNFQSAIDVFSFNQTSGGAEISVSGIGFEAIQSSTRIGVTTTISYAGNGHTVVGASEVDATMFTTDRGIKIATLDTIVPNRFVTVDVGGRNSTSADAAAQIAMRGSLYEAIKDMYKGYEQRLKQLSGDQLQQMGYGHVVSIDFNKAVNDCRDKLPDFQKPENVLEQARENAGLAHRNPGQQNNQYKNAAKL